MRIALVVESAGGGTGRHVLDLAQGLSDADQDVLLIYSPRRMEEGFRHGLSCLRNVELAEIPFRRSIGAHDLWHLRALSSLIAERGPFDVIHGHSSKAGALVRMLPRRLGAARVYSPHALRIMDPTLGPLRRFVFLALESYLALRPAHYIAGSRQEVTALGQVGTPAESVSLVSYGIDVGELPPRDSCRSRHGLPLDAPVIGFVGRFVWQKAPERAILAVAEMRDPNVHLAMVGDGPEETALRKLASEAGIRDRVHFLGFQNGQLMMPAFDALLMPSRYESSPYVLLEALMASVPVVTTAVGMAEEIIGGDGPGALMENTDDPMPWARATERVLDPEMADTHARGFASIRKTRSRTQMIESVMNSYGVALAGLSGERVSPAPVAVATPAGKSS